MTVPSGFWVLTFGEAIMTAGYAVSFPFLAVYLNVYRHLSMPLVGLFLAFSLFMTSFAHVIGGELSDVFGRKTVMVLSVLLRALLIGFMAWVIGADGNILLLLAVHPIGHFVGAFYTPAARAWVADSSAPSARMRLYGFLRIGTNVGWALGPAVGGLISVGSYAVMFGVTASVCFLCVLVLAGFVRDSRASGRRERSRADLRASFSALKADDFRRFCFFAFAAAMVMSQLVVATSLYSARYLGLDERQIGLMFSLNGVLVVGLQYWVTRLLERARITTGLAIGALLYAVGYLALGYSGAYLSALMGIGVLTVGEVAVSPGLQALGANIAPGREKGRYLGVLGLFQQAGASAGILVGTNAINFISPHYQQGPWVIVAGLAVVAALGFRSLGRRLPPGVDGLRGSDAMQPAGPPDNI